MTFCNKGVVLADPPPSYGQKPHFYIFFWDPSLNGNGKGNQSYKIVHWNGGARLWQNKILDLQLLLNNKRPDLCFVTETNLWKDCPDHERHLAGHRLIYPKTIETMDHARIMLVIRDDLEIEVLDKYMDGETATIWVRLGSTKRNSITVGGIYREFHQLGQDVNGSSGLENQKAQEERWKKIVKNWRLAGRNGSCVTIGDMNLDQLKWNTPDTNQEKMVELVQQVVETEGWVQLIKNFTRTWPGHSDSLLDHIWVNCPNKVISYDNTVNSASDHNVIEVTMANKDTNAGGHNVRKRNWKKYDKSRCEKNLKKLTGI